MKMGSQNRILLRYLVRNSAVIYKLIDTAIQKYFQFVRINPTIHHQCSYSLHQSSALQSPCSFSYSADSALNFISLIGVFHKGQKSAFKVRRVVLSNGSSVTAPSLVNLISVKLTTFHKLSILILWIYTVLIRLVQKKLD